MVVHQTRYEGKMSSICTVSLSLLSRVQKTHPKLSIQLVCYKIYAFMELYSVGNSLKSMSRKENAVLNPILKSLFHVRHSMKVMDSG